MITLESRNEDEGLEVRMLITNDYLPTILEAMEGFLRAIGYCPKGMLDFVENNPAVRDEWAGLEGNDAD